MGAEPPQRRTDGQAGPGTSALNNLFVFQPNIQRQYPPPPAHSLAASHPQLRQHVSLGWL